MILKLAKKIFKTGINSFFIALMFLSTLVGCSNNNNSNQTNSSSSSIDQQKLNEYLRFTKIDGGYSVALKEMPDFTSVISIPNMYQNEPVLEIEDGGFRGFSKITEVIFPNSILKIGEEAFRDCESLTNIVIPSNVTSIGSGAFKNCYTLTIYCESLSQPGEWNYDWNNSGRPFYWGINENNYLEKDGIIYVIIDEKAVITGHTSDLGNNVAILSQITIKGKQYDVTDIGSYAFSNCDFLTNILIPSFITSIGFTVFYKCHSLTIYCEAPTQSNEWNYDWNRIDADILKIYCPVYWGINENNYLEQNGIIYVIIDENAVVTGHTRGLENDISIPSQITIKSKQYYVTSIGKYAFSYCDFLTNIVIPSFITKIETGVFYNCLSLTIYCEAPSKPINWDSSWAFGNKPVYWGINEKDIIIQDGIQYLIINGSAVVTGYTNDLKKDVVILSQITINEKQYDVTRIEDYAFCECDSLQSVIFEKNSKLASIGTYAFALCRSLTYIVIPNSVISIREGSFVWCDSLQSVIFEKNSKLASIEYSAFSGCESLTSVEIPSGVTNIGDSAFSGCESLISIEIPSGVTNIGDSAFSHCSSLTSIVIPSSVTSIGDHAFYDCDSLTIYCEATSQPSEWDYDWNQSEIPVYWGGEWSYVDGVPTQNNNR